MGRAGSLSSWSPEQNLPKVWALSQAGHRQGPGPSFSNKKQEERHWPPYSGPSRGHPCPEGQGVDRLCSRPVFLCSGPSLPTQGPGSCLSPPQAVSPPSDPTQKDLSCLWDSGQMLTTQFSPSRTSLQREPLRKILQTLSKTNHAV